MGIYSDKLCETVPMVKRKYERTRNEFISSVLEIQTWSRSYYETEYLKVVFEYLENSEGTVLGKRFFLVTDAEMIGIKAAFAILNYPLFEGKTQNTDRNKGDIIAYYSSKREYDGCLLAGAGAECVYFSGLEKEEIGELEQKMQCIMSCNSAIQFVQIKKENLNKPWMRELLKDRECEIIYLSKIEFSYYLKIMNALLEGERYKMDTSLKMERILRNIQKKCGNRFAEEDIAWSLDQAEKSAIKRGDFRCLKEEDFKLDEYGQESSVDKLNAMIGLEAMKLLGREYAALSKEQVKNEKLHTICKHAIFVGKPGTGKTMCGELLAKIMSEQGQSNGNFIAASRKDIIAEYIGQTAPKVAALFSQARNGVLFVDEAGFLLQSTRGSFNQEAIKEFVRYMELYQDVMVIFALYPEEVEEWLKLDMGLSSRISRIIPFEDYSEEELIEIVKRMCMDRGYQMSEDSEGAIRLYLHNKKRSMGDAFGNAREGRRLVEAAVIARSMRCFENEISEQEPMLLMEDFEYGINRLQQELLFRNKTPIGFVRENN